MQLIGHKLHHWNGASSLYLFWQTREELDRSHKISVRTMTADNSVLFQIDNVPQLWTYPTNTWTPGDTVIDFYDLGPNIPCRVDCRLAAVVYEEESGKPARRRLQSGELVDPLIVLERLP